MINVQIMQATMTRMAELFRLGGINDWATAFETLQIEVAIDPISASGKILSMYGGMGSLNDLILYNNGQPLSKENNELEALRTTLYTLCRE